MIKIIITAFLKAQYHRKPFEILIDREDTLPFCPVKSLLQYCTSRGALPGPLFCQQNLHPLLSINLTLIFPVVYNFVALIPVDTKATAFELALLRFRLIKVSQMRKSALLAAGNLMLSKYISALNAS